MNLSENDQKQIINIIDTMIEASEHFLDLVKEKKYTESIYIFSSIIEGFTAVQKMINNDKDLKTNLGTYEVKITNNIKHISTNLENNNLLKITENLQFAFIPLLKKWKRSVLEQFPQPDEQEEILIGVYENTRNPIDAYPQKRIEALVTQAEKQNSKIIFFTSEDVNLKDKVINADYFDDSQRKKGQFELPDVIHNIFPKTIYHQSRTERKLRKQIPFTSFVFGDKFLLPKKLVESGKYAELLAPFKVIDQEYIVHEFLKTEDKAVIKPIRGARGENIYFVQKKGDRYRVTERKNTVILNKEKFSELLNEKVLPNNYMVQKYINARTKNDEPFDFRAHMQKNGDGKWQITKIYPRTGSSDSIQIELIKSGKLRETEEFLIGEFGEKEGKSLDKRMKNLAMDLSFHIDKLHGLSIDEMGLDIVIDVNKRFWIHEANIGPQTFAHEEERAVNVIAYSRYLAKNRIFHTNQFNDRSLLKNQFDSSKSELEYQTNEGKLSIGMLGKPNQIDDFAETAATAANSENVDFYFFSPNDVDYEEMLIRGHFYDNNEWNEKIAQYPDVIYDRLKISKKKNNIYEEFEDIPIINEITEDHLNKLGIFNNLSDSLEIKNELPAFLRIIKAKDLLDFIDFNEMVIVKPSTNPKREKTYYIEKVKGYEYRVINQKEEKSYNKLTLEHFIKDLIKEGEFFAYNESIDDQFIKGQMIKDINGEWNLINKLPIKVESLTNDVDDSTKLDKFINSKQVVDKFKTLSLSTVKVLDSYYEPLCEVELYLSIDHNMKIKIQELILNQLDVSVDTHKISKHIIEYAKHINSKSASLIE
ncbi:YheC/YheD family protein [Tenuibacillus multivorans]|uniref:YheC/D like ATP-grasp n=1 Tax=Tenuibacillus multivorans TaxID=237069 RepID=A0A1H0DLT4_9BACI|nr:YheC/YheD family protein [Tenuibacillus multivorans]SDN70951.1 YheC/D like ATP-grasp [Tenuibacillus multivorans]